MMQLVCVDDYEVEAFKKLPEKVLDYYRSGADDETTLEANREAFRRLKILPRFLRDVSSISVSLEIYGDRVSCPIGLSPSAMHKLAHPEGEIATARGANQVGALMILSTLSTTKIEDLADNNPNLTKWFQLYIFRDRNQSLELVQRAERAGFKAIVLTVDAPKFGTRRRDIRNNFQVPANFPANFDSKSPAGLQNLAYIDDTVTWADVTWLTKVCRLPVLVKGIMTAEDSVLALEYGASGVIVSNHGGRQLDGVPATIEVLGAIVRAVNGRCPVFVDGGIRTGSDVFKCLALGAKMVFVGRPVLWGLACEGSTGVARVLNILKNELDITMRLSGCVKLSDISRDLVIHEQDLRSRM